MRTTPYLFSSHCARFVMLGTTCILAAALAISPAHAKKTGEPFYKFETMQLPVGTKAIGGQVELRMSWIPNGAKIGKTKNVIVPVAATDGPAAVATKAAAELGKAEHEIADSFTITTDGGIVTLTRMAGVRALSPGGGTRPADLTGLVPLRTGAGIDPVLGVASWTIDDYGLMDHTGDFMIGCEGKSFTAPTYNFVMGGPKSRDELLADLLQLLRSEYGDRATLAEGVLRVADVETGDPFSGSGLDIGATYFSTDPNFTGFAAMTIPEPTGLPVLCIAVMLAVRRRR